MTVGQIILSIIRGILMFLGGFFLLIIIALSYIFFADPFHIRQYLNFSSSSVSNTGSSSTKTSTKEIVDNPLLSDSQEEALRKVGIDPSILPTEITPEMQVCLISAVGETRVKEIMAGATPSALELIKAKSCL